MEKTPDTPSAESTEKPRAKAGKLTLTPEMKADPISRKMILLSLFFASLAIACMLLFGIIYYKKHAPAHETVVESTPTPTPEVIQQTLNLIHLELQNQQQLWIEIAVECSDPETCQFIKNNQAMIRDEIVPILSTFTPEMVQKVEAKKLLRKKILDRLNTLSLHGKVMQVHFNNLSLEGTAQSP